MSDTNDQTGQSRQNRPKFQFVAATERDGRHGTAAQRLVRSHVRKQSSRRDQTSQKRTSMEETSDTAASVAPSSRRVSMDQESITARLARNRRDSRQLSTPPDRERTLDIVAVLREVFHPLCRYILFDPDPLQSDWYRATMIEDRLLSNAMHIVASLHIAAAADEETTERMENLMDAVHKDLISRISQNQITDATIGSVLCLAMAESLLGNDDKCDIHRRGAVNMLEHRVGRLQIDPVLWTKLYLMDVSQAMDQLSIPYLARPTSMPSLLDDRQLLAEYRSVNLVQDSLVNERLQSCYKDIILLSSRIEAAIRGDVAFEYHILDEACICIQHDLCRAVTQSDFDQISQYSAMIFMKTLARGKPFGPFTSVRTSTQLRLLFEQPQNQPDTVFLLWCAVMGAISSAETQDRQFFVHLVRGAANFVGCSDWESLKMMLTTFLWIERIHESYGLVLWQVIQNLPSEQP